MSPESREIVISAPAVLRNGGRTRLRILKAVDGSDSSSYLIPLPTIAPPGFKLSIHPSGEVHLKSRDLGTVSRGRIDFARLQLMALDGTFDRIFSGLITHPRRTRFLEGVLIPFSWAKKVTNWSGPLDLEIDELIHSLIPLRFGDTRHISSHLATMRDTRLLQPFDMIFTSDGRADATLVFVNLCKDARPPKLEIEIPNDIGFRRTLESSISQVRSYGGLFLAFPEGRRLKCLLERVGLRNLVEGFEELDHIAEQAGWKDAMASALQRPAEELQAALLALEPRPLVRVVSLRRRARQTSRQDSCLHSTTAAYLSS